MALRQCVQPDVVHRCHHGLFLIRINIYLLPFTQLSQNLSYFFPLLSVKYFSPIFRCKYDVAFAIPARMR